MPLLARCGLPWTQRRSVHLRLQYIGLAVYAVPGNMVCHDCGQYKLTFPWDDTYGLRNPYFRLVHLVHTLLGPVGRHFRLGLLDH